jgi:hypothetical protein
MEESRIAYSCKACGHIRGALEKVSCSKCGTDPAIWIAARIEEDDEAIARPGSVEPPAGQVDTPHGSPPSELFATSPAGTEGYDVNPELKVRR